jgi:hypothetical protein
MRCIQIIARTLLISFVCCHSVSSGQQTRNDGNWWVGLSESNKTFFVGGMFDGITLGRDFALRSFTEKNPTDPMIVTILNGFSTTERRLMSNVTAGQVVAGLDDFYKDYKNRRIETPYAVEVVLEGTAGMQKDKLETFIEQLRQLASKY